MEIESLAEALEREHHEIDAGIEAYVAAPADDSSRVHLTRAISALRRHIYLEEEFLFPALRGAGLVAPVLVMLREHGEIWKTLDTLERDLAAGGSAGPELSHELTIRLLHHNIKEEKILYPQADEVLTGSANEQLRSFLDTGELPEGWVCAKART